jgi:hypothetical protein
VVRPEIFVDIASVLERKRQMLAYHQSQKEWLDKSQGLGAYLEAMADLCREVGTMSGCFEYAEGWRRRLHFGFCSEESDPLSTSLAGYVAVVSADLA